MKPLQISLRKARVVELQAINHLLKSTNLPIEGVSENLANFLVTLDDSGEIIGVAGSEIYGKSGLLRSVAVTPEHRGEGLGHLLVQGSIDKARRQGVQHLYLLTETAERFMGRFGFKRIDRNRIDSALYASQEFKGACTETAVSMSLDL